ncbi:MAG TPA: fibronectin type III domain-containing protein [Candidatus Angelobacter sp.]|nr:fibronectin type III domain-containing protein [Candidatus Angelobacter sp.]
MRSFLLIAILAALLTSCASPGAPLPPSLNIPNAVDNLRADRKGETVTLSWTQPGQTTDGARVSKPGKMVVRRATSDNSAGSTVREMPLQPVSKSDSPPPLTVQDSLAAVLNSSAVPDFVIYSVDTPNNSGKTAGESNQVSVPLVSVLPTPESVQATTVAQGVSISWKQPRTPQNRTHLTARFVYRIMRLREGPGQQPAMVKQLDAGNEAMLFIDADIEWEKHYQYWITPVTIWENQGTGAKGEVPGDDSPRVPVTTRDVFPPAAPASLQAVFSSNQKQTFIDLAWTPNNESDLAGYNVYRRAADEQQFKKLNTELVKTSAFRDTAVRPGMQYFYAVSAVDLRSNESPKSAETSETVPRE